MKKYFLTIVLLLTLFMIAQAQKSIVLTPFMHQSGMYYSSDNITSEGFGLGLGCHLLHKSQVAGQADANILWGNGNAITTRLALGYQRKGIWSPAIFGTLNLAWGQRTQFLSEPGEKPPVPVWITGVRISPLKFQTKNGYISALEFGYGIGPKQGRSIEFSVLSIGINF